MHVLTKCFLNTLGELPASLLDSPSMIVSPLCCSVLWILVSLISPDPQLCLFNLRNMLGSTSVSTPCTVIWKLFQYSELGNDRVYLICFTFPFSSLFNVQYFKNNYFIFFLFFCYFVVVAVVVSGKVNPVLLTPSWWKKFSGHTWDRKQKKESILPMGRVFLNLI